MCLLWDGKRNFQKCEAEIFCFFLLSAVNYLRHCPRSAELLSCFFVCLLLAGSVRLLRQSPRGTVGFSIGHNGLQIAAGGLFSTYFATKKKV